MDPHYSPRPFPLVDAGGDGTGDAIAERIRFALGELERLGGEAVDGGSAASLAADIARLVETSSDELDGTKRELWGAVAHARAALRARSERGGPVAVAPRARDRLVNLHEEVVAAEAKAQRKLSAPSAYRKLIEAKKALATALEEHGYLSYDDLEAAMSQVQNNESEEELTRRITQELAAAEAVWAAFEASDPAALPVGVKGDALRARAYRLLGHVVPDVELRRQLDEIVAHGHRQINATQVLEGALRDAGVDPGDDAIAQGERYLRNR